MITLAFTIIMKSAVFPPIVFERTLKPFMLRVNEKIDAKLPLLFYRAFDFGAVFYAHRHIPSYAANADELKPPFFLLMWEEDWQRLAGRDELKMLEPYARNHGLANTGRIILNSNEFVFVD